MIGSEVAYLIPLAKRKCESIKRHILFPLAKSNKKESSGFSFILAKRNNQMAYLISLC
jgi:hypothetical protein